ncbi:MULTISPECIES: hypothetical protein [unclassified Streptomyces]|uniref:hypothetical protein n=1 Tax=unclassified Streptomyces TaxID=2593676 RepID=UPI00365CAC94
MPVTVGAATDNGLRGPVPWRAAYAVNVGRAITDNGLELDDPGVVLGHRWRPDGDGPVPETADPAYLATLDDIEKIRFRDIDDATEADINFYTATGRKG